MVSESVRQVVWPRLPKTVQDAWNRRYLRTAMADPAKNRRMFAYDRNVLPNAHLAALDEGIENLEQAMAATGLSIGYPAWNLLYYTLLCSLPMQDAVVIETGTNNGISTIVMAQALKDAGSSSSVRTVDIDPVVVEKAKRNVAAAGLTSQVTFTVQDSTEFLKALPVDHIDFAFLDGGHEKDIVLAEFDAVHDRVRACAGKVYFDNTATGGVAEALEELKARYGGNFVEFLGCSWLPPGNVIWQP